jgi:NAD(P)-dependent dehydrogenase (short-subunit alcohol dehydrogenase family)
LAQTGIRRERAKQVFETPLFGRPPAAPGADIDEVLDPARPRPGGPARPGVAERPKLIEPRTCYVCKTDFDRLHHFYDSLCPPCAELNFTRRSATADLRGRVAVITGARVKIGYQAAIMMLRAGCRVIVTTRFPRDAARRYASEVDAADWADRLEIHGVDLRYTPAVELFCRHLLDASERLDFIINNACQTVRKPVGFYAHLMACERRAHAELPAPERALLDRFESSRAQLVRAGDSRGLVDSAELSQRALIAEDRIDSPGLFPPGELDADLQQVDLRERNSWRLGLDEVSAAELIEVHLVNAVAPFVLNGRLRPLMARVPTHDKHIVNVSAMEGQFYRSFKTDKHPHTNMAKAALNMMTRTSAADYIADGIHMNSVDTGWITDEDPVEIARRKTAEHRFHPPLDIVDGAARIVDPIFGGFSTGRHRWGLFLKDYAPTDW